MRQSKIIDFFRTSGIFIFNAVIPIILLTLFLEGVKIPNGEKTVYTTSTGECYHYSSCSSLQYSKHKTTIAKAVANGYRTCSNCDTPVLRKSFEFSSSHYYFICPIAAIWSYISFIDIFDIVSDFKFLFYLLFLIINFLISLGVDALI